MWPSIDSSIHFTICAPISTDDLINNGKNVSFAKKKLFIVCVITKCHPLNGFPFERHQPVFTISMLAKMNSFRLFYFFSLLSLSRTLSLFLSLWRFRILSLNSVVSERKVSINESCLNWLLLFLYGRFT